MRTLIMLNTVLAITFLVSSSGCTYLWDQSKEVRVEHVKYNPSRHLQFEGCPDCGIANDYRNLKIMYDEKSYASLIDKIDVQIMDQENSSEKCDCHLANLHLLRGVAKYSSGRTEEAIQDYSEVIQLDPEFANAYFHRWMAYALIGETELANKDRKAGMQLDSVLFSENYSPTSGLIE